MKDGCEDFDRFERRCVIGMFALLGLIVAGGGWWWMSNRTPPMASAGMNAVTASPTLNTSGSFDNASRTATVDSTPTFVTPTPPATTPAVIAQAVPPKPVVVPMAASATDASPNFTSPTIAKAMASADSEPSRKFTLDSDPSTPRTVIVVAPPPAAYRLSNTAPATQPSVAVVDKELPSTAPSTVVIHGASDTQPKEMLPSSPMLLHTLPIRVVHVMTSESTPAEWYELKLNSSQASSLHDTLLALGTVVDADCDESDHLTPNTLPPAIGVPWWLPGELTDLDLITLRTGGSNTRRIVLALSARTGRAFLYASDAIAFPNE